MKRIIAIAALLLLVVSAFAGDGQPQHGQRLIYGTLVFHDDTLENAKVTITLAGRSYFWTTYLPVPAGDYVTYTASDGHFRAVVWGTDSLNPSGEGTYIIAIEHPLLQQGGITFTASGLTIPADTIEADSMSLKEILAQ